MQSAHKIQLTSIEMASPWTTYMNDRTAPRLYFDSFFLIYVQSMAKIGMNGYSYILASSTRYTLKKNFVIGRDITKRHITIFTTADYSRLMAEIGGYAQEGAKLIIQNGYLEQPPKTANRAALANV
jgi:hypothetical protein